MTEPDLPAVKKDHARDQDASGALQVAAARAVAFLEAVVADRNTLLSLDEDTRARLLQAAGRVSRPDPWTKRELAREAQRKRKAELRARDESVLSQVGIRRLRGEANYPTPLPQEAPALPGLDLEQRLPGLPHQQSAQSDKQELPNVGTVIEERSCYICKARFRSVHFFYDSMCGPCADFNYAKRSQTADLTGRTALVTGARVKIGYQVAIMLLRAGARVVATTRFPRDAAKRFARETDFDAWRDRLQIYGLDLRHTPSVEVFARELCRTLPQLDFVINNACQTVRRPVGFYSHLVEVEARAVSDLPAESRALLTSYERLRSTRLESSVTNALATPATLDTPEGLQDPARLSQLTLLAEDLERGVHIFPEGAFDQDGQQVDLRAANSWRLPLADVSAVELLEVQLVNAIAPFILNARLKPLMTRTPSRDKHIVNVSAMEGQFYRRFKTDKHPHTNMAKAALNMMTRTSARDYIKAGIHMNSVDTGWVTDEDAAEIAARKTADTGFHPPLDIVDGAARICDPIFAGFNRGEHVWGLFLKDYAPADW